MAKNPIAKALASAHLAPKVVKNKKIYCRKDKHQKPTKGRDCALWRIMGMGLMCRYNGNKYRNENCEIL